MKPCEPRNWGEKQHRIEKAAKRCDVSGAPNATHRHMSGDGKGTLDAVGGLVSHSKECGPGPEGGEGMAPHPVVSHRGAIQPLCRSQEEGCSERESGEAGGGAVYSRSCFLTSPSLFIHENDCYCMTHWLTKEGAACRWKQQTQGLQPSEDSAQPATPKAEKSQAHIHQSQHTWTQIMTVENEEQELGSRDN